MAQVVDYSPSHIIIKNDVLRSVRDFTVSQLLLLNYRKRWGMIYAFATLAGIFCLPNAVFDLTQNAGYIISVVLKSLTLPLGSFMIIVGMYVLNDLVDSNLDRANGKDRPIATGKVSKTQAWVFVTMTNTLGILLCLIGNDMTGIVISVGLVSIGIMYSAPKISLKDRFVVKTLAIAVAMMLCITLGATSLWSLNVTTSLNIPYNPIFLTIYIASMLGGMVFITSPFNDVADVQGDKAAGRKTIPIVIGRENTVKVAIYIAASMAGVSWIVFTMMHTGWIMPLLVSAVSGITIINMYRTLRRLDDRNYVRKQHKKSMPLHLLLQLSLVVGALLFWL